LGDRVAVLVDDEPSPVADHAPRLDGDLVMVDPVAALDRIGVEGDDAHPETLPHGPTKISAGCVGSGRLRS